MRRLAPLAVLPLAALPLPAAAQDSSPRAPAAGPLILECMGAMAHRDPGPTRSVRKGGKSSRSHSDDDTRANEAPATRDAGGVPLRFVFEFDGSRGRIRYPAALIPVVHSGGDGGWWAVRDLGAGDDAITGRIALNLVNHPRFTIDRHTGAFDLSGGIDPAVTGRCTKASAAPRLF